MIIRVKFIGSGTRDDPFRPDLPAFTNVSDTVMFDRGLVDVPEDHVPDGVAAFVRANPVSDLTSPLPNEFPPSLARQWAEHLARLYDLGNARWKPVVF